MDRRFILSRHYTRRDRTSPPRDGELEIPFGTVGDMGVGDSGWLIGTGYMHASIASEIEREARQTFRDLLG